MSKMLVTSWTRRSSFFRYRLERDQQFGFDFHQRMVINWVFIVDYWPYRLDTHRSHHLNTDDVNVYIKQCIHLSTHKFNLKILFNQNSVSEFVWIIYLNNRIQFSRDYIWQHLSFDRMIWTIKDYGNQTLLMAENMFDTFTRVTIIYD